MRTDLAERWVLLFTLVYKKDSGNDWDTSHNLYRYHLHKHARRRSFQPTFIRGKTGSA